MTVVTNLTDEDIRTELLTSPKAQGDDDATDAGDADGTDADDDGTDADDDGTDGGDADGTDA